MAHQDGSVLSKQSGLTIFAVTFLIAGPLSACVAGIPEPNSRFTTPWISSSAMPLQGHALRTLLSDNYVHGGMDDGPGEFFRANGVYQRDGGHGALVFEGRYGFQDGAVCVWGDGLPILCRRVVDNGDDTYTFINTADGTMATICIARPRRERRARASACHP